MQMGGNRHENKRSFVQFALRTAIDCWDKAKVRKKEAVEKEVQAQEELARETALKEAEKEKRMQEASKNAPWQDESWKDPDGDPLDGVEWKK